MCGIVGLICKAVNGFGYKEVDLFTNMLRMDTIRGPDSTGAFGVTKDGKIDLIKGDTDGWTFTSGKDYDAFAKKIYSDHRIVIGHNRKATKGSINPFNAHPFKEKHITLVHNGTIWNSDDLNKEVDVDSHAICHALSEHNAKDAIEKINGAFALVWFDEKDKTLSLTRNKDRPLYIVEFSNVFVISSEYGLPAWLQGREGLKPEKFALLPDDKICIFNLNDLKAGYTEVPYEEYSVYTPVEPVYKPPVHYTPKQTQYPSFQSSLYAKTIIEKLNLKIGDIVRFKASTYAENDGLGSGEVLVGYPIIDDNVNYSVFVRAVLGKDEKVEDYLKYGEIFEARIQQIRTMHNTNIVVFTRDVLPVRLVKDKAGNENDVDEVIKALEKGCSKCGAEMFFRDVDKSIVKKKSNGDYRIRCAKCLEEGEKVAQQNKASNVIELPHSVH